MISFHCFISLTPLQVGIKSQNIFSGSSSLFVTVAIVVYRLPPPSDVPSAVVTTGESTPAKSGLGAPRGAQPIPASHVPGNLRTRRHVRHSLATFKRVFTMRGLLGLFLLLFFCFGGHSLNLGFLLKVKFLF